MFHLPKALVLFWPEPQGEVRWGPEPPMGWGDPGEVSGFVVRKVGLKADSGQEGSAPPAGVKLDPRPWLAGSVASSSQMHHLMHQKVASSIPGQGTYLGCRFDPPSDYVLETTNRCFSLISLSQ